MPSFDELNTGIQEMLEYKDLGRDEWEAKIEARGVDVKFDADLEWLKAKYVEKISRIREALRGDWSCFIRPYGPSGTLKTSQELGDELMAQVSAHLQKEERLIGKLACVIKEVELRELGLVTRSPHHTIYYADYFNGTDGSSGTVHDGLKEANLTTYTGTDGTNAYFDGDLDNTSDDDYNDDFFYNETRGEGYMITDYIADDGGLQHIVLGSGITGQVSGDTCYILRAWKTIHQFTSETVRTPGDILKLRAQTTWNYGAGGENQNVNFDEDGTDDDYITIKGCDSSDDPWGDGNDVDARIDFNGGAPYCYLYQDNYWKFDNIEIRESDTYNVYCYYTRGMYLKDCVIQLATGTGLRLYHSNVFLENCTIRDNQTYNISISKGRVHLDSCAVDGGSGGTSYGVLMQGGILLAENTTFGASSTHSVADVRASEGAPVVFLRNCDLASTPELYLGSTLAYCAIHEEDKDQTFESHKSTYLSGTIERDVGVVRSGGADSSALMKPASECGPNYPLNLRGEFDTAGDFKLWCPASLTTVTIYMQRYGDWTAEPASSELYIQASYLNNGASASRVLSTKSSQTLPDSDAWTAFTTTFTPAREGWVYVTVSLEKYESGKGVYVDIKPVIS